MHRRSRTSADFRTYNIIGTAINYLSSITLLKIIAVAYYYYGLVFKVVFVVIIFYSVRRETCSDEHGLRVKIRIRADR